MIFVLKCRECTRSVNLILHSTVKDIAIAGDLPQHVSEVYQAAIVTSEHLRDLNKYWCEQCLRYNEARRCVRYETLPKLLVLQLKRFSSTFG